jgi:pimeloyl-ACP methyl ester carboxylesterase
MKIGIIISLAGLFFWSHGRSLPVGDSVFYIENNGARMPVIIRGDVDSKVLVVFLHGGPGGTSLKKIGSKAFLLLEEQFAVAYWDQRGSVFSHGGDGKKFLTLDQFVDDLDTLIDLLKAQYPCHSVFLMGHCWGGALGTAYLSSHHRQSKVMGWIDVAGAHNNPKGDSLSMVWVRNYAELKIEQSEDVQYWKNALQWYRDNPKFSSAQLNHYRFVKKARGYVRSVSRENGIYPGYNSKDLFRTPLKFIRYYINYDKILSDFIISDIDLTDRMKNITIPALIVWGNNDGLIPVELAHDAYRSLGTEEVDKQVIIFNNTAHTVFYEQPDAFAKSVEKFILTYQNREVHIASEGLSLAK